MLQIRKLFYKMVPHLSNVLNEGNPTHALPTEQLAVESSLNLGIEKLDLFLQGATSIWDQKLEKEKFGSYYIYTAESAHVQQSIVPSKSQQNHSLTT